MKTIWLFTGSTEANGIIENIMNHIARVTKKDPFEVRLANMVPEEKAMLQPMIEDLMKTSDYNMRKKAVEQFNRVIVFACIVKANIC